MKKLIAFSLLVVATFPAFGQKAVQVETWVRPTAATVTELRKLIQGEKTQIRFTDGLARRQFWATIKKGHKYPVLVTLQKGGAPYAIALLTESKGTVNYTGEVGFWLVGIHYQSPTKFRIDGAGGSG